MQSIRNRAKNRFPTVLLTLLSIVQALAALFALMNVVNHLAMRRARQDAANSDNSGWPAVAALLVILIGLALEVHKAARFWRMSMGVK